MTVDIYSWGVTERRITPEGEAARKDALAWLEANADENAEAEVVLKRVPDASGGVGVARTDGAIAGVVVTTGPSAYVEAIDASVVGGLLEGVAGGLERVWCRSGLGAEVRGWLEGHGGVATEHELVVVRAHGDAASVDEGVEPATMAHLTALEAYARAFAEERGRPPTRDLPSRIARRDVLVAEQDGELAAAGLHLGRTARLQLVGVVWTRADLRRRGYGARVLRRLTQEALASRPVVQALVDASDGAGRGLADACGFRDAGAVRLLVRP